MGIERMGPPDWLVERVRRRFGVTSFVETGGHLGDTAAWAAARFDKVYSVEAHRESYDKAVARHGRLANVRFVHGESAAFVADIVATLAGDAVFWLDAHWMGSGSYGEHAECPLLAELAAINRSPYAHFLFIDDARLFLSPPPHPHRAEQWPAVTEVLQALSAKERYTIVLEDVIVSVPAAARGEVLPWVQQRATDAWSRGASGAGKSWFRRLFGRERGE